MIHGWFQWTIAKTKENLHNSSLAGGDIQWLSVNSYHVVGHLKYLPLPKTIKLAIIGLQFKTETCNKKNWTPFSLYQYSMWMCDQPSRMTLQSLNLTSCELNLTSFELNVNFMWVKSNFVSVKCEVRLHSCELHLTFCRINLAQM